MFSVMMQILRNYLNDFQVLSPLLACLLLTECTNLKKCSLSSIFSQSISRNDFVFTLSQERMVNRPLRIYCFIFFGQVFLICLYTSGVISVLPWRISSQKYMKNEKRNDISSSRYPVLWRIIFGRFMPITLF